MVMIGSDIAKNGFANEQEVADKFNNWKNDDDAKQWLSIMMYDLNEIDSVYAEKIGAKGFKSDINITIKIVTKKKKKNVLLKSVENIQVKLVSTKNGFNQVEKRKVDQYVKKWHMPANIVDLLKFFDGEQPPRIGCKNPKRMFINEFSKSEQICLLEYFQKNIIMIISDVIRGRGRFAAEWTLVIHKYNNTYRWKLLSINEAISIYAGDCTARITNSGNIRLGNISLQRKGGDSGADTANMLQFKANPLILFQE